MRHRLHSLGSHAQDYIHAVGLCQHCNEYEAVVGVDSAVAWRFIAARDAAMSVYHFSYVLELIRSAAKQSPSMTDVIDHKALKAERRAFLEIFPFAVRMRHAIAHHSDLFENERKSEQNSSKSGPNFVNCLMGNKYKCTIDGIAVECDISSYSAAALLAVTHRTFDAFEPLNFDVIRHLAQSSQTDRR
jgi:hypothetical protein